MRWFLNVSTIVLSAVFVSFGPAYCELCCLCHAKDRRGDSCNRSSTLIAQGGLYRGSIVGKSPVDAVTGATKSAFSGGVAAEWKIKGNYVQGGISIGKTDQQINYNDIANGAVGQRNISLLLLDVPVLYNFHLLPRYPRGRDCPWVIIGLGGFSSFVLSKNISETGLLESKSLSSWAMGPYLRLAIYPLETGRFQTGLYLDFYRSFVPKFYDDPYFKANAIAGQLGIINSGLSLRF